jgi:hypothetical protein
MMFRVHEAGSETSYPGKGLTEHARAAQLPSAREQRRVQLHARVRARPMRFGADGTRPNPVIGHSKSILVAETEIHVVALRLPFGR